MPAALDPFIPRPDIRERHATIVRAPAELVLDVARHFDLQSIPLVHAIFWLRGKLMRSRNTTRAGSTGLVEELASLGWGRLREEQGRLFVAGAVCQPWQADVVFHPLPPEEFAVFAAPDNVKIAWTLEVEALESGLTRFSTETRAVATDEPARAKLRGYWGKAGIGIVAIRRLVLPALRREAERRWRAMATPSPVN